jgi:uncharacterized protein YutE (UPF0331/DUF86 family)
MEVKITRLLSFLDETIKYFLEKAEGVDKDRYFADRDIRNILDKSINDIILCLVDISEEVLKHNRRNIPDTYKDTVLACYEFVGDCTLKVAPLTKHRNEVVHQYLKINWQNVLTVKNRVPEIRDFAERIRQSFAKE